MLSPQGKCLNGCWMVAQGDLLSLIRLLDRARIVFVFACNPNKHLKGVSKVQASIISGLCKYWHYCGTIKLVVGVMWSHVHREWELHASIPSPVEIK